jgi:hypothetical protein
VLLGGDAKQLEGVLGQADRDGQEGTVVAVGEVQLARLGRRTCWAVREC